MGKKNINNLPPSFRTNNGQDPKDVKKRDKKISKAERRMQRIQKFMQKGY